MRVSFRGRLTMEELEDFLQSVTIRLRELGVFSVSGTNLYFNPCDEDGDEVVLVDEDGKEIEGWQLRRKPKKQKTKSGEVVKLAVDNVRNRSGS